MQRRAMLRSLLIGMPVAAALSLGIDIGGLL